MLPNKVVISGVVITVAVVAIAIVGLESQLHKPASTRPSPTATPPSASPTPSPTGSAVAQGPATFRGPDGTEARWVIQENDKPGSTAWEIHGSHAGITG